MKILILTRHFPPEVSGGVRRWFWLADELVKRNHDVTIVAPDLGQSDRYDSDYSTARIIRIPHKSAVKGKHKTSPDQAPVREPMLKSILRETLLLPDADIRWVKLLVEKLPEKLNDEKFDWVVTSSPPESLHYAGYKLKGKIARYWHADMRDYWLEYPLIEARKKTIRSAREKRIAKKWLEQADLRTAVDTGMATEMTRLSGQKSNVLPHFAPPTQMPDFNPDFFGPRNSVRLVYTGSFELSDKNRKITPLLRAYETACSHVSNLTLHIFGKLTPAEIKAVEHSQVQGKIFLYGSVSAKHAFAAQYYSDALIITAAEHASAIPGKLMEYRQVRKPIIAVGNGPWLALNPDIMTGHEAMIQASNNSLPISQLDLITLSDVCDQLTGFYTKKI